MFAYAILRAIPNKLGGVIALALAVLVLLVMPFTPRAPISGAQFSPLAQILFWSLVSIILMLTWVGARPVEEPYVVTGQLLTVTYFLYYFLCGPARLL